MTRIISEGTLRYPDLLRSFADELMDRERSTRSINLSGEAKLCAYALEASPDNMVIQHTAYELLEQLYEALEEVAPEGHYFGTLEGDGACFGYFLAEAAV